MALCVDRFGLKMVQICEGVLDPASPSLSPVGVPTGQVQDLTGGGAYPGLGWAYSMA